MENYEKILSPDTVEFEGSLNDLQCAYAETRRQRLQAEDVLATLKKGDDPVRYQIQAGFVKLCLAWEVKLEEDLKKRMPKEQQKLFVVVPE
jgi:hypothetical protein